MTDRALRCACGHLGVFHSVGYEHPHCLKYDCKCQKFTPVGPSRAPRLYFMLGVAAHALFRFILERF